MNDNANKGAKELDKLADNTANKGKGLAVCLAVLLVLLGILIYVIA